MNLKNFAKWKNFLKPPTNIIFPVFYEILENAKLQW